MKREVLCRLPVDASLDLSSETTKMRAGMCSHMNTKMEEAC